MHRRPTSSLSFFFTETATTDIYTLSLHDALPISHRGRRRMLYHGFVAHRQRYEGRSDAFGCRGCGGNTLSEGVRSEEHTSELQSHVNLVCRLLLEKKKNKINDTPQ